MLTSPTATNSVNSWPTLGRPKENACNAQDDYPSLKLFKSDQNDATGDRENGMSSKTTVDYSDSESIDSAINDLESTYARPEFNESFGTAIAEALNKAAHARNPHKQQNELTNSHSGGAGKKKKNTKKTILFSTGNRTYDGN